MASPGGEEAVRLLQGGLQGAEKEPEPVLYAFRQREPAESASGREGCRVLRGFPLI